MYTFPSNFFTFAFAYTDSYLNKTKSLTQQIGLSAHVRQSEKGIILISVKVVICYGSSDHAGAVKRELIHITHSFTTE